MHDIAEFLRGHDPFTGLDEETLDRLAARTEVEFWAAGTTIVPQGERPQGKIRVVRRGEVELVDRGRVVDVLGEGEMFGHPSVLSGLPTAFESRAREDSLTYALAASDVIPLLARPSSLRYLARSLLSRRKPGIADEREVASAEVAQQPARALIRRPPVICEPGVSVREAAQRMVAESVSSVLVQGGNGELGIVTDGDLRSRVVADGLPADAPVSKAMTTPVVGVGANQTGAEVMLTMLDHDIRHVPVFSPRSEVLGVIVGIDLVAAEARTPFVLRRAIAQAKDTTELADAASRLRSTVVALHRAHLAPAHVSEVISVVADALIRRMIELAIASEGPPPAEFAWMTLGSHGRREPVPSSDVDSGMAWHGGPESDPLPSEGRRQLAAGKTKSYMHTIANDVADCIRVLGWRLDPHGVTASGAFSASSIEDWRHSIKTWLRHPSDERVLIATSILLDGRIAYGEQDLDVKPLLLEGKGQETLLRWMLRLALAAKPPTGFRHDIVVAESGEHRGTLDIKHGGLLPIVDLARYAGLRAGVSLTSTVARLQAGVALTSTVGRLRAGVEEGIFDQTQATVLEEAFELFSSLRLENQVKLLETGREPDDHLDPRELSPLTRRYLRDAFREVAAVQKSLSSELAPT